MHYDSKVREGLLGPGGITLLSEKTVLAFKLKLCQYHRNDELLSFSCKTIVLNRLDAVSLSYVG